MQYSPICFVKYFAKLSKLFGSPPGIDPLPAGFFRSVGEDEPGCARRGSEGDMVASCAVLNPGKGSVHFINAEAPGLFFMPVIYRIDAESFPALRVEFQVGAGYPVQY